MDYEKGCMLDDEENSKKKGQIEKNEGGGRRK